MSLLPIYWKETKCEWTTPTLKGWVQYCSCCCQVRGLWCRWGFLPGVELALFGSLLLEDTSVFNLHRTGDETDFTAFLHQASYPPVIVKFLCRIIKDTYLEHPPSTSDHSPYFPQRHYLGYYSKPELTSLTWRKSLASKEMAMPGTGTSSSWLGL